MQPKDSVSTYKKYMAMCKGYDGDSHTGQRTTATDKYQEDTPKKPT